MSVDAAVFPRRDVTPVNNAYGNWQLLSQQERAMIDVQTLLLALGIGNLSFAALVAVYTGGTAKHPGLRLWMWARLVLGISELLRWVNEQTPHPWIELAEPAGWVVALALEVAAYCVFFQFRHWRRVLYPATALVALVAVAAKAMGAPKYEMIALVSALIAILAVAMGAIMLRPQRAGVPALQKIIGANDMVFALAIGVWAWTVWHDGSVNMVQATPLQALVFLCGYLIMIVNGFGFLLLCKQRDDTQMQLLATTDCLTGLANRRAFFEQAESARLLAARLRQPIALMMLDIDHFKQLNDRFGHATGDEALVLFADTARQSLREHDIMGRLGGEEFALALPGTDLDGALQAAERLRVAVNRAPLITSGSGYMMTVSIGVVLIEPGEALTAALARADHALYGAKTGGRNRVQMGAPMLRRA
jgi:diguanylate cyclase (GGDEF)-like protein